MTPHNAALTLFGSIGTVAGCRCGNPLNKMSLSRANVRDMTLKKWESITEWPLTVLSFLFLIMYAWQILAQPIGVWNDLAEWSMNALWVVFGVDYLLSLLLAEKKWDWFVHHLFDLIIVVLPMVRPLRVLRVLTALNALHRTSGRALRGRITMYAAADTRGFSRCLLWRI